MGEYLWTGVDYLYSIYSSPRGIGVCKGIQSIVVVQMSGGRVQECDSCGEEAAPGGLSPEAPVAPPRGQEGEESVCCTVAEKCKTLLQLKKHIYKLEKKEKH